MLPKDQEKLKVARDEKSLPDLSEPNLPDLSMVGFLIVVQCLMGVVCIVGGCIIATKTYGDGFIYVMSGIVSGVFMFTLAVVTAACKKYLSK